MATEEYGGSRTGYRHRIEEMLTCPRTGALVAGQECIRVCNFAEAFGECDGWFSCQLEDSPAFGPTPLTAEQRAELAVCPIRPPTPAVAPEPKPKVDVINHPAHYTKGIECLDYIHSHQMTFEEGCVVKYITRWRHKWPTKAGRLEDLRKAKFYLDQIIAYEEAREG